MTKKELKQILRGCVVDLEFWQDKPYTAATVTISYEGYTYRALGFSKVSYPDQFDPEFGRELAVKKAVAKVAGAIYLGAIYLNEVGVVL